MNLIFGIVMFSLMVGTVISLIGAIWALARKKEKRPWLISIIVCIVAFIGSVALYTSMLTPQQLAENKAAYDSRQQKEKLEKIAKEEKKQQEQAIQKAKQEQEKQAELNKQNSTNTQPEVTNKTESAKPANATTNVLPPNNELSYPESHSNKNNYYLNSKTAFAKDLGDLLDFYDLARNHNNVGILNMALQKKIYFIHEKTSVFAMPLTIDGNISIISIDDGEYASQEGYTFTEWLSK